MLKKIVVYVLLIGCGNFSLLEAMNMNKTDNPLTKRINNDLKDNDDVGDSGEPADDNYNNPIPFLSSLASTSNVHVNPTNFNTRNIDELLITYFRSDGQRDQRPLGKILEEQYIGLKFLTEMKTEFDDLKIYLETVGVIQNKTNAPSSTNSGSHTLNTNISNCYYEVLVKDANGAGNIRHKHTVSTTFQVFDSRVTVLENQALDSRVTALENDRKVPLSNLSTIGKCAILALLMNSAKCMARFSWSKTINPFLTIVPGLGTISSSLAGKMSPYLLSLPNAISTYMDYGSTVPLIMCIGLGKCLYDIRFVDQNLPYWTRFKTAVYKNCETLMPTMPQMFAMGVVGFFMLAHNR